MCYKPVKHNMTTLYFKVVESVGSRECTIFIIWKTVDIIYNNIENFCTTCKKSVKNMHLIVGRRRHNVFLSKFCWRKLDLLAY